MGVERLISGLRLDLSFRGVYYSKMLRYCFGVGESDMTVDRMVRVGIEVGEESTKASH